MNSIKQNMPAECEVKISAVINTYNSAKTLRLALESVKSLDEIVICDMYSTDETLAIAKEYGAKIVMFENCGFVEPARNFALSAASNDWCFVLDSDERAPVKLIDFMREATLQTEYDAYNILRVEMHLGKPLRSTEENLRRFMRKSKTDWPKTIHSIPEIDGNVSPPMKQRDLAMEHHVVFSVSDLIEKYNKYTDEEVDRKLNNKKYASLFRTCFSAFNYVLKIYIIKGAFRNGRVGFYHTAMMVMYKFYVLFKIWERQGLKETKPPQSPRSSK